MVEVSLTGEGAIALHAVPDGHGEAALLLIESIIHGLISNNTLSVSDAVEVIEIGADSHVEVALGRGGNAPPIIGPVALLEAIGASLQHDLTGHA